MERSGSIVRSGLAVIVVAALTAGCTESAVTWRWATAGAARAPFVVSLTPATGSTAGGTTVQATAVSGVVALSAPALSVTVDGVPATGVQVLSVHTFEFVTPPRSVNRTGDVDVVVTLGATTSAAATFHYEAVAPTLTQVTPGSGPVTGGTPLTLRGTGFAPGTTVQVGSFAAGTVDVRSGTELTCVTSAGTLGLFAVTVTHPDAGSVTVSDAFEYTDADPTLTQVAPTTGSTLGGTTLTLTGANFVTTTTVEVDGVAAGTVDVVSATELTCVTASHAAGLVSVTVRNPSGGAATLVDAFEYVEPTPVLTLVSPTTGSTLGGTTLTLTGVDFVAGATVEVGGVAAGTVDVVSSSELTCVTTSGTAGRVSVTVRNPGGAAATLADAFEYLEPAPILTQVSPATGPVAGGTTLTLTGADFVVGATVDIGGVVAGTIDVVSSSELTCVTTGGTAGLASVTVHNPAGGTSTLPGAFEYAVGGAVELRETISLPDDVRQMYGAQDLDGDGLLDVVLLKGYGPISESIYERTGPGVAVARYSYSASEIIRARVADTDQDGIPELGLGERFAGRLAIVEATANDTYAVKVSQLLGATIQQVCAGDSDGDGTPEWLIPLDPSEVQRYEPTANDVWAPLSSVYGAGGQTSFVAAGDLDKDGTPELVFSDDGNSGSLGRLYVYEAGSLVYNDSTTNIFLLAVGDTDGDGLGEVIGQSPWNWSSGSVPCTLKILESTGSGNGFTSVLSVTQARPWRPLDVDGDGVLEFWCEVNDGPGTPAHFKLAKRTGSTLTEILDSGTLLQGYEGRPWNILATPDSNGDGRRELVVLNALTGATTAIRLHILETTLP